MELSFTAAAADSFSWSDSASSDTKLFFSLVSPTTRRRETRVDIGEMSGLGSPVVSSHARQRVASQCRESGEIHWAATSHISDVGGTDDAPTTSNFASVGRSLNSPTWIQVDDDLERCANTAFRVTFHGNRLVKHRTTVAEVGGVSFVVVDRFPSGHTDGVYHKSKKLWEQIPLGQARVYARTDAIIDNDMENTLTEACGHRSSPPMSSSLLPPSTYVLVASVVGLRKFGHWDDAPAAYTVQKEPPLTAIALDKVDGEPGQLTAFKWGGVRYWVIGCRKQHMVTRIDVPEEDVIAYANHSSSIMARSTGGGRDMEDSTATQSAELATLTLTQSMARVWRALLHDCIGNKERAAALHEVIAANAYSLCFDAMLSGWERLTAYHGGCTTVTPPALHGSALVEDGEALTEAQRSTVGLDSVSHRSEDAPADVPMLWFYAITADAPSDEKGWCLPVHEAYHLLNQFGLPVVGLSKETKVGSPEGETLRQTIMGRSSSAGAVLYGANEAGLVVRLWKCRSYPHMLERMAQESIVTHRLCGDALRTKLRKKMASLSRENRLCTKNWERDRLPFLLDYALWLHRERVITPLTDLAGLKSIRGSWLSWQRKYHSCVVALPQNGRLLSFGSTTREAAGTPGDGEEAAAGDSAGVPSDGASVSFCTDAVLFVGPQGCGKSTMARTLFSLLTEAGCTPRWLNQDEIGSRTAFLATACKAVESGCYTHLLLDKMNLDHRSRSDYADIGVHLSLAVAWIHSAGVEAMVDACYDRVLLRGANHLCFCPESGTNTSMSLASTHQNLHNSFSDAVTPVLGTVPSPPPSLPQTDGSATDASPYKGKLYSILEESVRRYQIPSNSPLLELEVTMDPLASVAAVWAMLQQKGCYDLPPLSSLHVEEAMRLAHAYEQLIGKLSARPAAVVLRGPPTSSILTRLTESTMWNGAPKAQQLQESIEVMLQDYRSYPDPVAVVQWSEQMGQVHEMQIRGVIWSSKVTLLCLRCTSAAATTSHDAETAARRPPSSAMQWRTSDHFAILAKTKKATHQYCEDLFQYTMATPDAPLHSSVLWLTEGALTVEMTIEFLLL